MSHEAGLSPLLLTLLACPQDHGPLLVIGDEQMYNPRLRRAYRIDDGIPALLIDDARDVDDEEHEALLARATATTGSVSD
ncbi:protein YcaR in KDO2-Lipid A biosynthesis cluster [Williamsia sp. 1138]|uniref:Trm112 family protein n=1 Tax=Gordonia rubripertincta TaxID=36822 RepID=A0ABT4MQM2_GORRU|nr:MULTISPECIES: Trm112 family protein [Mycobacteriales]MCZ4549300.1 Trm112 family protein [Gordonia rubripertincta]OZG29476.1 protein YcaR in KDO2-Lipid A biosynthesis cluster [Williamsia sp. 1138]